MRIKDISLENRPRERMQREGASVLSTSELLAVILQKGSKKDNVIEMCNRLISKFGIEKLSKCTLNELKSIIGIGDAKSSQILALFEFNKRYNLSKMSGISVRSAKHVYDYFLPKLMDADKEHFMILHLDSKNKIIKDEIVFVGTLNSSLIHPREIFKSAIKESANSIIVVHNHPSGDPEPSNEDKLVTEKLFEAGELLGIKVLDHVIVGRNGYYSFNDNHSN